MKKLRHIFSALAVTGLCLFVLSTVVQGMTANGKRMTVEGDPITLFKTFTSARTVTDAQKIKWTFSNESTLRKITEAAGAPRWNGAAWPGSGGSAYTLPVASATVLGGVKPDGTSIINTAGTISVTPTSVGLGSVENTALSTWAGSTNITTIGTITAGSVPAAKVSGLATSATTDTTNATNITSGTLSAARVATLNQNTTGNAGTATALAANGTVCSAGQAAQGIDASGNATGCVTITPAEMILVDATAGNQTYTMPANGHVTVIKTDDSANTVTIQPAVGFSFPQGINPVLYGQNEQIEINTSISNFYDVNNAQLVVVNPYVHPVGDGNLHVPATSTTNNGKVLTAGATAGSLSWTNPTAGTVTGVTGTAPVISSGGTTPAISMAAATGSVPGYLTAANWTTFNNKQNALTAGVDYLAPNGSAAALTSFPTLNQSTTGTAANVTGTVAVANGGTGRATGTTAYSLVATGTTATGAQQTLANGATTQVLVGGGATALPVWTAATGSGSPVRATSPVLVTPNLGTPSAGVATNLTGTAAGLTAGKATALAANGTVCSAGQAAQGIDASGNATGCVTITPAEMILVDATAGNQTYTMPANGHVTVIKTDDSANTVTIQPAAGFSFPQGINPVLYGQNEQIEINTSISTFYDVNNAQLVVVNPYAHPIGDGNLHVPATSTTNSGKVLTAGATAGSLSWVTPTTGSVTSVTGTAPVVSSGGAAPVISMAAATGSVPGYLTAANWTTFNAKEPPITAGTTVQYLRGDKSLGTFATDALAAAPAETVTTIKTALGITTLSGSNTGDNATNSLYSGLVSNATHTGDATGSTALTVSKINGTSLAGLATGILKNTTATGVPSIAVAGVDYLTPTGSAAALTSFPTLNQNTTGTAAALAANGTNCSTGQAAQGINASGAAEGCFTPAGTYSHPTGDGNLHVPATSTTSNGKVLTAGATAGSLSWVTPTTGSVTGVTGTAPVVSSGGTAPVISMAAATGSVPGYLTAANWTTFNNKQNALTAGVDYLAPNGSAAALTSFPTLNQSTTGTAANVTGTVAVANGGTGRATGTTAYSLVATGTTATGAQQTLANGATTQVLVGGGTTALPAWTTATGSGAPVRATSPTLVTPNIGTAVSTGINPVANNLYDLGTSSLMWKAIQSNLLYGVQIYQAGNAVIDAGNIGSQTVAAATGNAGTATKLATARAINGVAFNGTAAITVADATKEPINIFRGNVANPSPGTPVTLFALPGNGLYHVFAYLTSAGDAQYNAYAVVLKEGASQRIVNISNGTYMSITLSGNNVQATEPNVPWNIYFSYQRIL